MGEEAGRRRRWGLARNTHALQRVECGRLPVYPHQLREAGAAPLISFSRAVLFPLMLRNGKFSSGGVSPGVRDPGRHRRSCTAAQGDSALLAVRPTPDCTANAFWHAVEHAAGRRIVHAYFGALPLLMG